MIRRILVPLDGSYRAETVLPHVVSLATVFDARIDLLHVIGARRSAGAEGVADPLGYRLARADRKRYLEGWAKELREGGFEVWTRVEEGGAAEIIVELLHRGEHDLVALTHHGAGDDRQLRIGCTVSAVILNARTSILLVPDSPLHQRKRPISPAVYRRVVAPVDCSPRSDWSLAVAAAVARGAGAGLKVVHVLDTPAVVSRMPDSGHAGTFVDRILDANRDEAARYLEEVVWRLRKPDLAVETEVLEASVCPAEAVRDLVSSDDVDLAILSAHGRNASPEWPLGGTATKLVFWARQPVLVLQDQPRQRLRTEPSSRAVRALARET